MRLVASTVAGKWPSTRAGTPLGDRGAGVEAPLGTSMPRRAGAQNAAVPLGVPSPVGPS